MSVRLSASMQRNLAAGAFFVLLGACSRDVPPEPLMFEGMAAYEDTTAEFPRVRYEDGTLSMNDRCIVRMVKLNRKMGAVYVNGRPIGFC